MENDPRPDGVHETEKPETPVEPTQSSVPEAPPAEPVPADDLAPDASEPGDELPHELSGSVHEGDIVPDHVDKAEVEPDEHDQDQA